MDEHNDQILANGAVEKKPDADSAHAEESLESDEENFEVAGSTTNPVTADDAALQDELDVEAALAAVAALPEALAEHEAAEVAEVERLEAEAAVIEQVNAALQVEAERRAAYYLPHPPMIPRLRRGQAASAIPALLLMAAGVWLTFTLSTKAATPSAAAVGLMGLGGMGASLIAYWFTSGRWARGVLLGGFALLSMAAVCIYLTHPESLGAEGWPLFLVVAALAILLSTFLSPPAEGKYTFAGIALGVAGLTALAVTTDAVSPDILNLVKTIAPLILVVVVVLLLLSQVPLRRR